MSNPKYHRPLTQSGQLEYTPLAALVKQLELCGASVSVRVNTEQGRGWILLDEGMVTACEYRNSSGEQALHQLLEAPSGTYAIARPISFRWHRDLMHRRPSHAWPSHRAS